MAGQPKKRAMIAELERLTREEFGDDRPDATHLDFAEAWVASGKTLVDLAREMSAKLGIEILRERLSRYLHETFGEDASDRLTGARARGAHAIVEGARADSRLVTSKDDVPAAKLRSDLDLFIAQRWNRTELGENKGTNVVISLGGMALDALRTRAVVVAVEPPQLGSGEETVLDAEVEPA